jgi:hypothetical protein
VPHDLFAIRTRYRRTPLTTRRTPGPLAAFARWMRQVDSALRLATFGRDELRRFPHYPLPDDAWPEWCACELPVGHLKHGKAGQNLAAMVGPGDPREVPRC